MIKNSAPASASLHWLPVCWFSDINDHFKALPGLAPQYILDLFVASWNQQSSCCSRDQAESLREESLYLLIAMQFCLQPGRGCFEKCSKINIILSAVILISELSSSGCSSVVHFCTMLSWKSMHGWCLSAIQKKWTSEEAEVKLKQRLQQPDGPGEQSRDQLLPPDS